VWLDGRAIDNKSILSKSSSLTECYSATEITINKKQKLGLTLWADGILVPHLHKAYFVARHFGRPHMKRLKTFYIILFFLLHSKLASFGQESINPKNLIRLKVDSINIYCKNLDNNKTYVEAISEGEIINHKGGFETYFLKDQKNTTLFRIRHSYNIEDSSQSLTFYYKQNKIVKAIVKSSNVTIDKKVITKTTIYYLDNNKIIRQIGTDYNKLNLFEDNKRFLKEFERHK